MARKRMIDPSFWSDEKVGTVEPRARLLFMGLISQADDAGRLNGHPALIKSLIFPYDYDISLSDVEQWICLLANKNLIQRYEVDSQKYILIPNFNKHQTINRPQPSKLPEPKETTEMIDHGVVSESSVNAHAQKNLIEFNLREYKTEEEKAEQPKTYPFIPTNPFKLFESEGFGTISKTIADKLGDMIDFYSERWVIEAMKIASIASKRNLSYVEGILRGFKSEGIDEPWNKEKVGVNSGGTKASVRQGSDVGNVKPSESQPTILPSKWAKVDANGVLQMLKVP